MFYLELSMVSIGTNTTILTIRTIIVVFYLAHLSGCSEVLYTEHPIKTRSGSYNTKTFEI